MLSPLIDRKLVVTKLIKERCRLAERESERMQKSELVRDVQKSVSRNNEIYQLFPPRKAWCGMMDVAARKKLDAAGRNAKRLYYTYRKAQKANSQELWYVRLCAKADSIVRMVEKRDIMIGPPRVIPIEKDRKAIASSVVQYVHFHWR